MTKYPTISREHTCLHQQSRQAQTCSTLPIAAHLHPDAQVKSLPAFTPTMANHTIRTVYHMCTQTYSQLCHPSPFHLLTCLPCRSRYQRGPGNDRCSLLRFLSHHKGGFQHLNQHKALACIMHSISNKTNACALRRRLLHHHSAMSHYLILTQDRI